MSIGSRWTILFVAVWIAIAGCSVADAATLRRRDRESESNERELEREQAQAQRDTSRMLKHSKAGSAGSPATTPTTSVTVTGNSVTVTATTNAVDSGIQSFEAGCRGQTQDLERCLITERGDIALCKQCLLGIATLTNPNLSNLRSCTNTKISNGMCDPACEAQVTEYFDCGAGTSFGTVTTVTATATSTSVSRTGFAPSETCNAYNFVVKGPPASGDECFVPGSYQYQMCFFQGVKCTCRYDELLWMCLDYP